MLIFYRLGQVLAVLWFAIGAYAVTENGRAAVEPFLAFAVAPAILIWLAGFLLAVVLGHLVQALRR